MNTTPLLIEEENLSSAWRGVLSHIVKSNTSEITPLILTLTGFSECANVRNALESSLKSNDKATINTVAETIFPNSLYQLCGYDRQVLYKSYLDILPRIKKIDSKNSRGTYFERLISFQDSVNQLEIIINSYQNDHGVRRSKLQASIFDVTKDHLNTPYQSFPCLQHVTFYVTRDMGLVVNSFYAIQYLYERAYGNWLGLINLGKFIAKELNIELERFNCYIGIEQLDTSKREAHALLEKM